MQLAGCGERRLGEERRSVFGRPTAPADHHAAPPEVDTDVQPKLCVPAIDSGFAISDNGTVITDNAGVVSDNGRVVNADGPAGNDNGPVGTEAVTAVETAGVSVAPLKVTDGRAS